jgi:flagellar biosynthesis anti-sigma factor FlgM
MKIDPTANDAARRIGYNDGITGKTDATRSPRRANDAPGARDNGVAVELSIQAESLARYERVVADLPEVRAERVDALKESVQAGTYRVPIEALVERLIKIL